MWHFCLLEKEAYLLRLIMHQFLATGKELINFYKKRAVFAED